MKLIYEIIITSVLFLCICFIYKGQERTLEKNGHGNDGDRYYKMAEQIQNNAYPIASELPFIKRIGTPFLIGTYSKITGISLLDSALLINLIGAFITLILLMFWLRIFIDVGWIRVLLLFLFMMFWRGPLRAPFFYPMITDAWGSVWFVGGLLLLHKIRQLFENKKDIFWLVLAFSFVVAIGNLFRESNAVLAIALFFLFNPLKGLNISLETLTISHSIKIIKQIYNVYFKRQSLLLCLPIIIIILINLIVSKFLIINHTNDYSYFKTISLFFYKKSIPQFVLGIFLAYGPLITLLPFYYRHFKTLFIKRQELLFIFIITLFLSFIGGSDTERLLFMSSFPIFFILIGGSINNIFNSSQRWWLSILFVIQTITYRFYWFIPASNETEKVPIPFFTLIGNQFESVNLHAYHGSYLLNSILFIEYLLLFAITFYVLKNKISFKSLKLISRHKFKYKN